MIVDTNYYLKVLRILKRDPKKIWPIIRLRTGGEHFCKNYPLRNDGISSPPVTVAIRRSFRCNLNCVMCGQWGEHGIFKDTDPDEVCKQDLTTREIKKFIDDVSEFKPYIYFTGGEPLINDDIFELIRYCSDKHLITGMSSNSTMLESLANEVVDSGLDYFYASLDAPKALNDDIRKGDESFQHAINGIKKMVELRDKSRNKLPLIQVQSIVVKENQGSLFEMGKIVEDLGVDVWGLQLCVFTTQEAFDTSKKMMEEHFDIDYLYWKGFINDFDDGLDYGLLEDQLKMIKDHTWEFRLRLYNPLNTNAFDFRKYFLEPGVLLTDPPCMYPYAFCQMQPNGDLAFCGSQPDYVFGNLKDNDFQSIWNNQKARNFRLFIRIMGRILWMRGMVSRLFRVRITMSLVMLWMNPRMQCPMLGLIIGTGLMVMGVIPM